MEKDLLALINDCQPRQQIKKAANEVVPPHIPLYGPKVLLESSAASLEPLACSECI